MVLSLKISSWVFDLVILKILVLVPVISLHYKNTEVINDDDIMLRTKNYKEKKKKVFIE